jgi:hypothetical protein
MLKVDAQADQAEIGVERVPLIFGEDEFVEPLLNIGGWRTLGF